MRRKASMIVLAVLMAAGAIWTAVYDICLSKIKTISPILNAAVDKTGVTYWDKTGSARNCNESYEFTFDDGTWLLAFEGQSGLNGWTTKDGQGAGCLAFYKGSSMTVQIGVGGGDGTYKGGGKTIVETNFAMPIGYGDSGTRQAIASGAGGGVIYNKYGNIIGGGTLEQAWRTVDGTFKGFEGNGYLETVRNGDLVGWMGTPATQGHGGYRGFEGYGFDSGNVNYSEATMRDVINPNGKCRKGEDVTAGGGGGAGYRDGGGGANTHWEKDSQGKWTVFVEVDYGGGGSCTPWCYPYASSDIQRGPKLADETRFRNTADTGAVYVYRIDPAVIPGNSQTKQYGVDGYGIDKGISITAGSLGSGRWTPYEVFREWGNSVGTFDCGIEGQWVYSVREGGEWEGLAPDGERSETSDEQTADK